MAHPNEELARRGYKAFAEGDLATIGEIFAEDVVWHISGSSPLARDYRGKDEVLGFLGSLMTVTEGTFRAEVHDILANDEHAVVIVTVSAERDGKKALHPSGGGVPQPRRQADGGVVLSRGHHGR